MSLQVSDAEDAIANGRRFYNAKQYRPALEQFTIAMKLCQCSRKAKRERCSCKNFEKVAGENGDIFKEAMYNCHCAVGKTFNKCDRAIHIQALDYRAATFEAIKQLERAKRDAEWILELAPRLPDGYLRLGKVARLMKEDEFAWKLFSAGIEVARANGQTHTPKAKSLYAASKPLQMKFYHKDPLQLPADIVYWIMSYCDLVTRIRCLRVSKAWKGALTATVNTWLWKDLEFTGRGARRPPSIQGLRKLGDYAGRDVRRIIIPFANSFGLIQSKLNVLLSGAKSLEQLEIGFPMRGLEVPRYAGMCKSLKQLKLSHFNPAIVNKHSEPDVISAFPISFIINVADILEHLHLDGLPSDWFRETGVPSLPRLRSLRMQLKPTTLQTLPLFHIATKTPALEDLWLNEVWIDPPHNWYENWDVVWPHLKSLTVVGGNALLQEALVGIVTLTSLHHGKSLQHIDLSFSYRDEGVSLITKEPMDEIAKLGGIPLPPDVTAVSRSNSYDAIQSVRLYGIPLNPAMAREMFEHAIVAGKLHAMDIVFPLDVLNSTMGSSSIAYLTGYGWLKGAATIRTMGITRFRFRSYPRSEDDLPLPAFLASFPNLEELEVGSAYYEAAELCMVIEAIIKVTKLKVLYQSQIRGAMMDQLIALGERHGVKMIWGERPRPWPVVLEDT